jgi:hypothetical protein
MKIRRLKDLEMDLHRKSMCRQNVEIAPMRRSGGTNPNVDPVWRRSQATRSPRGQPNPATAR